MIIECEPYQRQSLFGKKKSVLPFQFLVLETRFVPCVVHFAVYICEAYCRWKLLSVPPMHEHVICSRKFVCTIHHSNFGNSFRTGSLQTTPNSSLSVVTRSLSTPCYDDRGKLLFFSPIDDFCTLHFCVFDDLGNGYHPTDADHN